MSNALAIAAVTAVLKDLLDNAIVDASLNTALGSSVKVQALPPDLVEVGSNGPVLNLYMYRVTPNTGWRNAAMPSRNSAGSRISNQPLALDLHYLLSAHATEDLQSEILLGYAIQQLHERPVLTRDAIRTTLASASTVSTSILPPAFAALAAADLADQVELVKITPQTLSTEDLSKLWSAIQSSHRPTAAYMATVVLIESRQPGRSPSPVVTIGAGDRGPTVVPSLELPVPTLTAVTPPAQKPSAYLGESVVLTGHHLAADPGTTPTVELVHARLAAPIEIDVAAANASARQVTFALSTPAESTPAGIYSLSVLLTQDGKAVRTNALPLAVAPEVAIDGVVSTGNARDINVQVSPAVLGSQAAVFVLGSNAAPAATFTGPAQTLAFHFDDVPAGTYPFRLRVDGIESVLVDYEATPPAYLATQRLVL
ncbi:MAG: DUF4255 domain-containing protein [Planctomycetes bacterium]|nr:DUF4255 domain-containing protein [Planctomycetota bacterium]